MADPSMTDGRPTRPDRKGETSDAVRNDPEKSVIVRPPSNDRIHEASGSCAPEGGRSNTPTEQPMTRPIGPAGSSTLQNKPNFLVTKQSQFPGDKTISHGHRNVHPTP